MENFRERLSSWNKCNFPLYCIYIYFKQKSEFIIKLLDLYLKEDIIVFCRYLAILWASFKKKFILLVAKQKDGTWNSYNIFLAHLFLAWRSDELQLKKQSVSVSRGPLNAGCIRHSAVRHQCCFSDSNSTTTFIDEVETAENPRRGSKQGHRRNNNKRNYKKNKIYFRRK